MATLWITSLDVDCPTCGMEAGWACRLLRGDSHRSVAPHKARRDLSRQINADTARGKAV